MPTWVSCSEKNSWFSTLRYCHTHDGGAGLPSLWAGWRRGGVMGVLFPDGRIMGSDVEGAALSTSIVLLCLHRHQTDYLLRTCAALKLHYTLFLLYCISY
ncbi:hypothetical protein E2C01_005098 [Portunus trituberculatus]|uniref:Uncharacterized protein n=1 Tax=Portunus trituberculatus TaxID=210409 RepID=A0A5B7CRH0_PORTR|nr:hypothetical protein [Portunus trituberculatus]